jgi:D-alanine-D-alanine ligase
MVMVETYAPGRELTVSVMGDRPLCVTEILTDGWYDYDAKYRPGGSRHVLPAEIPAETFDACMAHALRAHRALGCRGLSRTDFRWDESRGPGRPDPAGNQHPAGDDAHLAGARTGRACAASDFPDLCRWLVEDASCDR